MESSVVKSPVKLLISHRVGAATQTPDPQLYALDLLSHHHRMSIRVTGYIRLQLDQSVDWGVGDVSETPRGP